MPAASNWPVRVTAVGQVAVGAVLWRYNGQLNLTAVVKTCFDLAPERQMQPRAPQPLRVSDEHLSNHPMRSLVGVRENVPLLPRADVLCTGHAYAGQGTTQMVARIALSSEAGTVLNKALHIYGDRRRPDEPPAPFEQMPLSWERSYGGIGFADNPLGVGFRGCGDKLPNIVAPDDPAGKAAGFGPIPASFPCRRKLLGGTSRKTVEGPIAEIPSGFSWSYFQAAPEDQRIERLRGDEWLTLDGLHPELPQLRTRLPGARAVVQIYGYEAVGAPSAVPLQADLLHLDTDTATCTVLWRGSFPVSHEPGLSQVIVAGALELPGQAVAWPDVSELERSLPAAPDAIGSQPVAATMPLRGAGSNPLEQTAYLSEEDVQVGAVLPFGGGLSPKQPSSISVPRGKIPHSPFEGTVMLTPEQEKEAQVEIAPFAMAPAGQPAPPFSQGIPGAPWESAPAPVVKPPPPQSERCATVDLPSDLFDPPPPDTPPPAVVLPAPAPVAAAPQLTGEQAAAERAAADQAAAERAAAEQAAAEQAAAEQAAAEQAAAEQATAEQAAAQQAAAEKAAEERRKQEAERFKKEQEDAQQEQARRAAAEKAAKKAAAEKLRSHMYGGFKRKR